MKILSTFGSSFLQAFGVFALLLGVGDILYPNTFHYGLSGLEIMGGLSVIWGIYKIWPRFEITRQMTVPDTKITIKAGDLFNQTGNIVIGMTDVFDTEKGQIIAPDSIQGQFLSKMYGDDRSKLDADITKALRGKIAELDRKKTRGKNMRYPIGTVATLTTGGRNIFCVAYSSMGRDLKAQSDVTKLSVSLNKLWEEIRIKGHNNVSMAVLGSDLARI